MFHESLDRLVHLDTRFKCFGERGTMELSASFYTADNTVSLGQTAIDLRTLLCP